MKTILIIDDDELSLTNLNRIIECHGYKSLTSINGKKGIDILSNNKVDLVLTDYLMSDISGIDVLNIIKKDFPKIPLIMLSGYGDVEIITKSIQLGAIDFIQKPVYSDEIIKVIDNILKSPFDIDIYTKKTDENLLIENKINEENISKLMMYKKNIKTPSKTDLKNKYIFDFILSLLIMISILPVFLIIGILIKLNSKGTIFYKQKRVGIYGKEFFLYKFRTMISGADKIQNDLLDLNESSGPVFKIKNDPRITKFGKLLRKSSMDELPQFFNVIKGDMSIVGPRPCLKTELNRYKKKHFIRLTVRPGITCIWQTQKNRYKIKFDEWMKMDMEYIDKWSFKQDIKLIFKTIISVLRLNGQ